MHVLTNVLRQYEAMKKTYEITRALRKLDLVLYWHGLSQLAFARLGSFGQFAVSIMPRARPRIRNFET